MSAQYREKFTCGRVLGNLGMKLGVEMFDRDTVSAADFKAPMLRSTCTHKISTHKISTHKM